MYSLQTERPRKLLISLNPLCVLGVVTVLIVLRTTSESFMPDMLRRWDLLLPVAVYLGQRRNIFEGALLIFLASYMYSLNSVAPVGMFTLLYTVIFLLAKGIIKIIYANNWSSVFGLILSFSLLSRFLMPFVAKVFDQGWPVITLWNLRPLHVAINALLGVFLFFILSYLDRLTHKVSPQEIQLSEGGL